MSTVLAAVIEHWPYVLAAIAAATAGIKLFLSRRRAAAADARTTEARAQRDAAVAKARETEMRATVVTDHMREVEAANRAADRIRDVPVTSDPVADRGALYDALGVPPDDDSRRP